MPTPYESLVAGQYANKIRLRQEGGLYLGDDFILTSTPTPWLLKIGHASVNYHGHPFNLSGYWIYKDGADVCWQAPNYGNGPLVYWNIDGHAHPDIPEDWELFTIAPADRHKQTVIIYNAAYVDWARSNVGSVDVVNAPYCVGLTGSTFRCDQGSTTAAVFYVEFV